MDRILQAFSSKFFADNREVFRSAEAIYLLSYSLMILQTDLHNPQVKEKMKFEDFKKMTKGINAGEDIDGDYLKRLYKSVGENPLAKHSMDKRGEKEDREGLFKEESKKILRKGQQLLVKIKNEVNAKKKPNAKNSENSQISRNFQFLRNSQNCQNLQNSQSCQNLQNSEKSQRCQKSQNLQYSQLSQTSQNSPKMGISSLIYTPSTLKLLLEMIWSPILAAFSVVFERCLPESDEKYFLICISGIESMIKLTCILNLSDIRDTFIVTLIKFANLSNPKEISSKNLECVKTLLNLAFSHGRFFAKSWKFLIAFLSRLDQLLNKKPSENQDLLQIDPFLSERTLGNSSFWNGETLLLVFEFLCESSKAELKEENNEENSQMFALKKIVDIAEANMERVKIVWSRMWKKLTEFFSEIAGNKNKKVGFYVVDAIKRLNMKSLQVFLYFEVFCANF